MHMTCTQCPAHWCWMCSHYQLNVSAFSGHICRPWGLLLQNGLLLLPLVGMGGFFIFYLLQRLCYFQCLIVSYFYPLCLDGFFAGLFRVLGKIGLFVLKGVFWAVTGWISTDGIAMLQLLIEINWSIFSFGMIQLWEWQSKIFDLIFGLIWKFFYPHVIFHFLLFGLYRIIARHRDRRNLTFRRGGIYGTHAAPYQSNRNLRLGFGCAHLFVFFFFHTDSILRQIIYWFFVSRQFIPVITGLMMICGWTKWTKDRTYYGNVQLPTKILTWTLGVSTGIVEAYLIGQAIVGWVF